VYVTLLAGDLSAPVGPTLAGGSRAWDVLFPLPFLSFTVVGLLVALRRPENAIGWLFLVVGVLVQTTVLGGEIAIRGLLVEPGSIPGAALGASITSWLPFVALYLVGVVVLFVFPDGHFLSRRWKWLAAMWGGATTVACLALVLAPGPFETPFDFAENPLGIDGAGWFHDVGDSGWLLVSTGVLAGATCLVVRFRRSRGVERQQIKWIVAAGVLVALGFVLVSVAYGTEAVLVSGVILSFALAAIPVAVAVAILRYRLYEIDRLISKTLVYASLTVILGAAYVGLVLVGQAVFAAFAGGSNLAIAVSTLVVAALFLPLRTLIQRVVDRRFYRRRYGAQRTLEAFGARLREEVDLETLSRELRSVVMETMQPTHVSLWLRTGSRG
jgi:hypothetical protein